MGDSGKLKLNDFLVGVGSALAAEMTSYSFRHLYWLLRKDETAEYKEKLTREIRLACATIEELPEGQTIKNMYLKAWRSDLIEAANEGDMAVQSSTARAEALKSALTKLQHLTSDANIYLQLLEYQKKKEALNSFKSAAYGVDYKLVLIKPYKETIESYGARNSAPAPAAPAPAPAAPRNSKTLILRTPTSVHAYHFECDFVGLEKKEPLNSAAATAGNPKTLIAPGGTIYYSYPLERFDFPNSKEKEPLYSAAEAAAAGGGGGNPEMFVAPGCTNYLRIMKQFGFSELKKKEPLNSAAAAAGNPERLIAPEGTIYYQYPLEWYAFPKLENKEPLYSAAGAGKPKISLSINPSRRPHFSFEDHHYLNKKRVPSESCYGPTMLKMVNPTPSKKQRVLGDSLGEEFEKNFSWLDSDTEWALTYDGEPSINDRMKMKGKCPEGELDEETGHGKANTPALSCSPSSSYGGANDHIPPSFPEENDA